MRTILTLLLALTAFPAHAAGFFPTFTTSSSGGGSGPLSAPVSLGTCTTNASGTTCVITATNNCAAGSMIWVAGAFRNGPTGITAIADSQSNSYTLEANLQVPTSSYYTRSAYSINIANALTASSDTITLTMASSTNYRLGAAYCVANNGGTFALDASTTNTGATTPFLNPSSGSNTTGAANAIAFAYFYGSSGTSWSYAPSGWTTLDNVSGASDLHTAYILLPTNGTTFNFDTTPCASSCPTTTQNWASRMSDFHD